MGFNKRKMEDARRQEAEKEAAARRATEHQIFEDADPPDHSVERTPGQADADADDVLPSAPTPAPAGANKHLFRSAAGMFMS